MIAPFYCSLSIASAFGLGLGERRPQTRWSLDNPYSYQLAFTLRRRVECIVGDDGGSNFVGPW